MKVQATRKYKVTSPRTAFTMDVDTVNNGLVTGNCYPGGYRGTIPLASIRSEDEPKGPVFTFREVVRDTVGLVACIAWFGPALLFGLEMLA